MKLDWRKILVIILFIVAAILFGFIIYWFFWRPLIGPTVTETTTTVTPGGLTSAGIAGSRTATPTTTGALPATGTTTNLEEQNPAPGTTPLNTAAASALVNNPAYFPAINSKGQVCYYNPSDKKIYEVDSQGSSETISDQVFYNPSNIKFDNNCAKAIISYLDGSNTVYDFVNNKQYTLPKHWQDFSFSSTGNQITFKNIGLDVENRYLVTAKYDGSQAKVIEQIGANAYKVTTNWSPNNQVVATYVEDVDASRSEIYFIGQNNENFKSMIVEGRGFAGIWSPSGNKMLYSVYSADNDYKPTLWVSNAYGDSTGSNRQKISLETWADQCTFASENYAVCVAPKTMPSGAGLDKENSTKDISDNIWAVNLMTGATALIAAPSNITKIDSIYFSQESPNNIFLVSGTNNYIYKIDIQK